MSTRKYVGPDYQKSLVVAGRPVYPKDFTDKQIDNFIRSHPQYKDWWASQEEKAVETAKNVKEK